MDIELNLVRERVENVDNSCVFALDFSVNDCLHGHKVGRAELRLGEETALFYSGNISYTVFPKYRGRGLAAEIVRRLCAIAAQKQVEELFICVSESNRASQRVCEKIGAQLKERIDVSENEEFAGRNIRTILRYCCSTAS